MDNAAGDFLTEVMVLVFKLNGQLLKHGDRKVEHLDLTSARWQMLGAIALSPGLRTAPQLARKLAISRQGAQKQLNLLVDGELLSQQTNPRNARSPFYQLTDRGRTIYGQAQNLQRDWAQSLAAHLDTQQLDTTRRLLKKLSRTLDTDDGARG